MEQTTQQKQINVRERIALILILLAIKIIKPFDGDRGYEITSASQEIKELTKNDIPQARLTDEL